MPCFLSCKSKSVLAKPRNTNARGPRYRPAEARSRGGSHHPTSRVRSSFATTLPSELAQCTSRSRSYLDGIDDAAHRRREAPPSAQHRGLVTYEEHNDWLQRRPSNDPIVCLPLK